MSDYLSVHITELIFVSQGVDESDHVGQYHVRMFDAARRPLDMSRVRTDEEYQKTLTQVNNVSIRMRTESFPSMLALKRPLENLLER